VQQYVKKIRRILRKPRTGKVCARVKRLYKEKDILKLLARLRDLKLSLISTLGMLSALEADCMIDALSVANPSLLEWSKDEVLSKDTIEEIEETRRSWLVFVRCGTLMNLPMHVRSLRGHTQIFVTLTTALRPGDRRLRRRFL
jgi:hypothetical protein